MAEISREMARVRRVSFIDAMRFTATRMLGLPGTARCG